MKIEAPNKAYSGVGPGRVVFSDGVGETDDDAALAYYRSAGYTVGGKRTAVEEPEPPDPREVSEVALGTRLRDAAVDPQRGDFLAPINAGKANPHGPTVVSPEIHASGPAGIHPGPVRDDKQEAREAEFARLRLIDQKPAGEVVDAVVPSDDRGPLGLSDPASTEQSTPKSGDNKAAWVDHAVAQGVDRSEAESLSKAQLIERFGG